MGIRGLDFSKIEIPFGSGINTKGDKRAQQPPALDIADDVRFDEPGGLQTRYPFGGVNSGIFGGGAISDTGDARRLVANGDELLLFTSTALYSWNARNSRWVLKGTHLAVSVDEQTKFSTTGDQINADRAELSSTILYAWEDTSKVYVAAVDRVTNSVLMAPTALAGTGTRPRLVNLVSKIMLFWHTGTDAAPVSLVCIAIDPTSPATAVAGASTTVLATPNFGSYYDVAVVNGTTVIVGARRVTTTSYSIIKVTSSLAVTAATPGRTCDGPIAVSVEPSQASVQVIRANGTNIQGDYITISSLADVTTGQAIGTVTGLVVNQIAAAHRSVQDSGAYRCYVFWSAQETSVGGWKSKTNWVDTAGTLGTQADFIRVLGVASRAFDYNGRVYVWLAFAGASTFTGVSYTSGGLLQNTYFLYRDDAFLVAQAVADLGGGLCPSIGRLPLVGLVSASSTTFAWCGAVRRRIPLGGKRDGYSARAPRDITFTFDSNDARRCARLGKTLYIATGEGVMQYDGAGIYEVGAHIYPWNFGGVDLGAGGSMAAGTYAYKMAQRWDNAQGERERSTTATVGTIAVAGPAGSTEFLGSIPLYVTHKTTPAVAAEMWRTVANPTADAPFFLITSVDPSVTSNPNRYLSNDTTVSVLPTFDDALSDVDLAKNEAFGEAGSVLENLAPPPCSIIIATEDRLFISGIPGFPNRVAYSKTRNDGEVAAFNDQLTIEVPPTGGKITGLAFNEGVLTVFRETATYAFPGDGYDNTGNGNNYGPARVESTNLGCVSQEAIAVEDRGLIVKTSKGWKLLTKGWSYEDIGVPVSLYDTDTVVATHVMPDRHQIRILTTSRMLVLDTLVNQWGKWTISDGVHATIWNGTYYYLTTTGPKAEGSTYSSLTYGMDVETAWIKNDQQSRMSVLWFQILGEFRSACHIRVRVARDYQQDGSGNWLYNDDVFVPAAPTVVGGPIQLRHGPKQKRCEAIKIRLTVYSTDDVNPPTDEACKLTGLALMVGVEPGLYRGFATAQTK